MNILSLRRRAMAQIAAEALKEVMERSPYEVKAIQIDGGGEYMEDSRRHVGRWG